MKIRYLQEKDILKVMKLYDLVWPVESKRHLKAYYKNRMEQKQGFVAVEKKEIIGVLTYSKVFYAGFPFIDAVIVDKEHRKKGVATTLIKKFEDFWKKKKARRVYSTVEPDNKASIKMNKALGWKKIGYWEHVWNENEKEIIFSKKLR
jgi:RimJ/RimL family protein N-acetyltransferase